MDRCFKIHGYLSSNKAGSNKKFAGSVGSIDEVKMEVDNTGFTPAQYNTLLMLLNKKDSMSEKDTFTTDASAHLVGTLCQLSHITTIQ